ncbi:hypothetical protein CK203_084956 [Vitis vinifera]|uniref:Uncharacterized protein n=1 Tax=Vitis vinifera TaxID=29760 RepID=A0A438CXH8_VITVI|nr:hypothetical protein CK203_084956 [Vitis vinifera]
MAVRKLNSTAVGSEIFYQLEIDREYQDVGTPPPNNTWCASLFGATPSGLPKGHVAHSPIRTPRGGTRHSQISYPSDALSYPGPIIQIIDCSEQALLSHPRQSATAHVLPPAGRKDRSDGKSPPTISDSRLQARVHLAAMWILGMRGLNIGAVCGNPLIQSTVKSPHLPEAARRLGRRRLFRMARSHRETTARSERQMQALLQETARLRKENAELRIQASSTGPPRGQCSRGQGANSRLDLKSIYPGTAGPSRDGQC